MATLIKRATNYYSKLSVRVGRKSIIVDGVKKQSNTKKVVYIKLFAKSYKQARD